MVVYCLDVDEIFSLFSILFNMFKHLCYIDCDRSAELFTNRKHNRKHAFEKKYRIKVLNVLTQLLYIFAVN